MNEVEKPQVPLPPRTTAKPAPKPKPSPPKKPVSKPSTPKPTTPRAPSSKTPSNTYLGSDRNDQKVDLNFHVLYISLLILVLLLQPRASSVRPDCEISVEAQPATGLVIFWMFMPQLISFTVYFRTLPLQYQLTLVSNSFSAPCRYNCPANCLNKKGKVWGTLFYDVVSLSNMKQTSCIMQ